MMGEKKYKPAKNLRYVQPRVCAFCKHFDYDDGIAVCERDNGINKSAGDAFEYYMTCDRFVRAD